MFWIVLAIFTNLVGSGREYAVCLKLSQRRRSVVKIRIDPEWPATEAKST